MQKVTGKARKSKKTVDPNQLSILSFISKAKKDTESQPTIPDVPGPKRLRSSSKVGRDHAFMKQGRGISSLSGDVASKESSQTAQVDQETLPSSGPSEQPEADTPKLRRSERARTPRRDILLQSLSSDEEIRC